MEKQGSISLESSVLPDRLPAAAYFILASTLFEQWCYVGVRNLMNQYLKAGLKLSESISKSQVHLFVGCSFLFPVLGAIMSDSYIGKYRAILIASCIYVVGTMLLSLFTVDGIVGSYGSFPVWAVMLPSMMVAMGSGFVMSNASPLGGDQFHASQGAAMDRFFGLFYVALSVGGLAGQYANPYIKEYSTCFGNQCYFAAYGLSFFMIVFSLLAFVCGTRFYITAPPVGEFLPWKAIRASHYALGRYYRAPPQERARHSSWLEFASDQYGSAFVEETKLLGRLVVMLLPFTFAWMLFDQSGTEWQNQYGRMDKMFLGLFYLPTEVSSSLKTILVIILVPFMSYVVYPLLSRIGFELSEAGKMAFGFFFMISSFVVSTIVEHVLKANPGQIKYNGEVVIECLGCLNGGWQMPQMFLLALGEAMLSPTIVQFCYTQVGSLMKASASSLWLLTVALGNYTIIGIDALVELGDGSTTTRMWIFSLFSSIGLAIFMLLKVFWFVPRNAELDTILEGYPQSPPRHKSSQKNI
ncbi:hypothetical protein DSO57_1029663 [Entomophthora muscae]|uniref:Uncharacterized protein n=1 Tax=Entomophthora muscae TaxID=34485 RepID=A0ACC2T175_9FUNG|nr:hypothetical protein DSO57_1029663 [Entomophthora muscae]